jgi:hypothetical protein
MQPCRRHWWSALPVGSRVAFHIGESSGEDNADPNVATGDGRAPPYGSTAPPGGGAPSTGVVVRVVTRHVAAWR